VSGLQLVWVRGYRRVQLQLDSQCAVSLLQSRDHEDHAHAAILYHAYELLRRDWVVHISHVFRESNHVADHLANRGHSVFFLFPCCCARFCQKNALDLSQSELDLYLNVLDLSQKCSRFGPKCSRFVPKWARFGKKMG
ncbi:Putative ribonuclease H protein At1g65750, partial [Linum perenne]